MVGKQRSGLANDRRAYGCATRCPPTYRVKYDGNGNTSGQAPKDMSYPYRVGATVTVLGNTGSLEKTLFSFAGWNTAADGTGTSYLPGATFLINENTQLYAKWIPTYTVTYNGNGSTSGSVPTDSSSPYIDGSTVTVLANSGSLAISEFAFVGWNTQPNGSGTSYSQGNTFTINANTNLYAQWTRTYTVTYNGNGSTSGSVPTDSSSPYTGGLSVTVLGNPGSLAISEFAFAGWNTRANGLGEPYSQGNTFTINANANLYAQWIPTYTVTYNGNGSTSGSVPAVSSYAAGSTVTVPGNTGSLMQPGLVFDNWNTAANGDGTSYSQGDTFIINADETLYAQWTIAPLVAAPTSLSSVGGNEEAYILFTQVGTVTNYEYSTDDGETFVAFGPPQIYSPVNIKTLSNGTTYTVRLKAVNSGALSLQSLSVTVVPTGTELLTAGRLIHLDANNTTSYSGSGTAWTNLDSGGAYSATLQNSPTFDNTNKWFTFNGINQIAQIAQAPAINLVPPFVPFTVQIWARVNTSSPNFLSFDGLISKQFGGGAGDYDGYSLNLITSGAVVLSMNGGSRNENYGPSSTGVFSNDWALYTIIACFGGGSGSPSYIYVSGRRVLQANFTETRMNNALAPLQFPRGIQETGENFCPADVGAFYLYNTALTQEQIIQNFDATKHRYNV